MPKISIIMPVYNGVRWLDESISSCLNQTFGDFELICVNDSSTDNSEDVLKSYSVKDKRVRYYTKPNGGPASALNFGVEKAEGEYLCFLDQDDKYAENYLDKMYGTISGTRLNMCLCNAFFWEGDKLTRVPYVKFENGEISVKSIKDKKKFMDCHFPQWTKIVRREFWLKNNVSFLGRKNKAHDVPVHYQLLFLCDKIGYIEDCIYYHRYHSEQISYSYDVPYYYYLTFLELIDWGNVNLKNWFKMQEFKKLLEALIFLATISTERIDLLYDLKNAAKKNYSYLKYREMKKQIKKRLKKLDSTKSILPIIKNANVGRNSYCSIQPFIANPQTKIGNFVSIGENVRIGHGRHPLSFLSTSPYFYYDVLDWKSNKTNSHNEYWDYAPVIIGNDVWIGDNVLIKNGITVGDGAVVGMGAVVTKDVPPYAIVAGVPAKVIKYRFDDKTIEKLLDLKWWNLDDSVLKDVPYDNIEDAIQYLLKKDN